MTYYYFLNQTNVKNFNTGYIWTQELRGKHATDVTGDYISILSINPIRQCGQNNVLFILSHILSSYDKFQLSICLSVLCSAFINLNFASYCSPFVEILLLTS